VEEVRYVQADSTTFTAGGLTSGVDLALHIVADRFGQEVAQQTADYMEYMGAGWKTNQGISVLTTPVTRETWSGPIASLGSFVLHVVTTGSSTSLSVDIPTRRVVAANATFDDAQQNALVMTVHIPGHSAIFTGTMNADGDTAVGNLVQDGKTYPLTLTRQAAGE